MLEESQKQKESITNLSLICDTVVIFSLKKFLKSLTDNLALQGIC